MKIVTPKQMNEIDSLTIHQVGIPGIVLMENAALRVVEEVIQTLGAVYNKNIFIFAGKGNNGGDAFAAARHLYNKGAVVKTYILADKRDMGGDAAINLAALENMGAEVIELKEPQLLQMQGELAFADLVVDGIFGTGLKGGIQGLAGEVVKMINSALKPVISIDIPSGVNGETGAVEGPCIRAGKTVTFGLPKVGMVIHPGCEYVGEMAVADISIPEKVINSLDIKMNIIENMQVAKLIPGRRKDSNKSDYGRIFIISGSVGMTGAGCLSAGAALRTGAGLVYLGVPSSLVPIYDSMLTESITVPLEDTGAGYLSKDGIPHILNQLKRMKVAVVGPGLSLNEDIMKVVASIIEKAEIPLILDADALNAVSRDVSVLAGLKVPAIITPHPGEMARLAGISNQDVQNNRLEVACDFSRRWKVITVLKGARTVVATPDGTIYINPTGNSGMATGGTGDVLTGVIAGLIGQGAKPEEAAVAGVYIHGLAGDSSAVVRGEHGTIAGDLVEELPYIIKGLVHL